MRPPPSITPLVPHEIIHQGLHLLKSPHALSSPTPLGSWLHHHPIWRPPTPAWNSLLHRAFGQSNSQLPTPLSDLRFQFFFSSPEWLEPPCNSSAVNPSQTFLTVEDTLHSHFQEGSYLAFQHCAWLIQGEDRRGRNKKVPTGCCSGSSLCLPRVSWPLEQHLPSTFSASTQADPSLLFDHVNYKM